MLSRLEGEGRIKELKPHDLLKEAGLKEGMTCVDMGCGTGVFSIPMAEIAGNSGKVYGVDDSSDLLDYLSEKNPPTNLLLIKADVRDTGLESSTADFCLLAFILHEINDHEKLLAEAYRLLKPGGIITVVEWRADRDTKGPPKDIRLSRDDLKQLFNIYKFQGFNYLEWTENHYVATGLKQAVR